MGVNCSTNETEENNLSSTNIYSNDDILNHISENKNHQNVNFNKFKLIKTLGKGSFGTVL